MTGRHPIDATGASVRSLTNRAWDELFKRLRLDRQLQGRGVAQITADEIKQITGREPRLVTKFDTRESRPDLLKQASATILAIENGKYALLAGNGYYSIPCDTLSPRRPPGSTLKLETLPVQCTTESQVLDLAHAQGVFEDFFGEDRLWLTGRGRRRSRRFEFTFHGARPHLLAAEGVQIEVDGGYEGARIYVIEAKLGLRENFHIRQLYYPMRMWLTAGVHKRVVPVFACYSNHHIHIYEFAFGDPSDYHSIKLVKGASYYLDELEPRPSPTPSLHEILEHTAAGDEPDAPFPQADDIRRVIDVIDAVAGGVAAKEEITDYYEFAERQASYYADAARYLGMLRLLKGGEYALTREGQQFVRRTADRRIVMLAEAIAARPAARSAAKLVLAGTSSDQGLARAIKQFRPELADDTLRRRAQTMRRWLVTLKAIWPSLSS